MTRSDRLRAHVDAVSGRPVVWGKDDCSAWVASWVSAETGIDLDLPIYLSREEATHLVSAAGGLDRLWSDIAADLGLCSTMDPMVGDVGIVQTSLGLAGAIFAAGGFAFWRAEQGALLFRPRTEFIVSAWTVPENA